jgi:hypothetical protein
MSCWIPDPRRVKMAHKNWKKLRNFMFWSAECYLLRAEGFSCSLSVLYGGLGISKPQFLIKKQSTIFRCKFFYSFWSLNPWIRNRNRIRKLQKCWIRILIKLMRIRNAEPSWNYWRSFLFVQNTSQNLLGFAWQLLLVRTKMKFSLTLQFTN